MVASWPDLASASADALRAYCQGALRDGTYSASHRTHRIGQADPAWLHVLQYILKRLGSRSWIYREGRDRRLWILETTAPFLSLSFEPTALAGRPGGVHYARGYFDADGGMPRDIDARLYFQFVQKDFSSLQAVADILRAAGIAGGRIHNPSRASDPHYWRFFVSAASHWQFMRLVGSWHPRKRRQIADRLGRW
jgi:hypothetical protein